MVFGEEERTVVARYGGQGDKRINKALLDCQAIMNSDVLGALMEQVQDSEKLHDAIRFLIVGGFMETVFLSDGTRALVPSKEWLIDAKGQGAE